MVGLIILAVIIGIIVLIMLVPVGADIRYEEGVFRLSLKAAWINLKLVPKQKQSPKEEKPKKEKKKEKSSEEAEKEESEPKKKRSLPFNLEEILDLLKTVLRGFGRFGKKFSVDRFVLHWIAAGWEPYTVARVFSIVNAGLSQLSPICVARFHCKDSSVWTDIDFVRDDMFLEFGLTVTIRIGQILGTVIRIAFGALAIFLRSKRRVKKEAKEEQRALEEWLKLHPEDREVLEAEQDVA